MNRTTTDELSTPVARELGRVGVRRDITFAGVHFAGRRRRPSGEPPPLPRDLRAGGTFWLLAAAAIGIVWLTLFTLPTASGAWARVDDRILLTINGWRNGPSTMVFEWTEALTSEVFLRIARVAVIAVLVFYRRWRHLLAGVVAIALTQSITTKMTTLVARPRPVIESLISWEGYSHPSVPVAALAVTVGVVGYSLLPEGDARRRWFIATGSLLGVVAFARLYLGVDHPTDAVTGFMVATAITVMLYKLFVPAQVFPVTYRRRSTAHLDIDASRRAAIVAAVRDQLGIIVADIRPIGSAASAGSTPLLLTCIGHDSGEGTRCLFAKLYAASHLRADRWYKLGRLILYGSLEDEARYTSVRRLVEYEDYLMRVMAEAAVPGAKTYGFVEITPEREYLLLAEFLDGAVEIGDIDADDDLIHRALGAVCRLWEAGLAHRDIKPSNIMVRDGDVLLIDLAFAQIRPSPWRQAVDLANMMLLLALRADPHRVYARALLQFSPDNIAEAFAATQSVTIPAQTRRLLRRHRRETGEDLVAIFRRLAPHREPIAIQRWSRRRIAVTLATILVAVALVSIIIDNLRGQGFI